MIVESTFTTRSPCVAQQGGYRTQQVPAVGPFVARVAVGKMTADVAEARCPEQRVADRMQQHVGVGMSGEPPVVGDIDTADDELTTGHQRMDVEALTDSHRSAFRTSAASARSSG